VGGNRLGAFGQIRFGDHQGLAAPGDDPFYLHAGSQAGDRIGNNFSFDLHEISLGVLKARIGQGVHQRAVITQEQQTLTVHIQTAGRVHIRNVDVRFQRGMPIRIGK